jgi:hypothetical protein
MGLFRERLFCFCLFIIRGIRLAAPISNSRSKLISYFLTTLIRREWRAYLPTWKIVGWCVSQSDKGLFPLRHTFALMTMSGHANGCSFTLATTAIVFLRIDDARSQQNLWHNVKSAKRPWWVASPRWRDQAVAKISLVSGWVFCLWDCAEHVASWIGGQIGC